MTVTAPEGTGKVDIIAYDGLNDYKVGSFTYTDVSDYVQQIEDMKDEVHSLVDSNTLSKDHGDSLTNYLEGAEKNIKIGNKEAAVKNLNSFTKMVDGILAKTKNMSEDHRNMLRPWVDTANNIAANL